MTSDKATSKTSLPLRRICILLVLLFVAIEWPFFYQDYESYQKLTEIQQHGGRAVADVDSIYVHGCPKRGLCVLYAKYHYTTASLSSRAPMIISGDDWLGLDEANDQNYAYASSTKHLPVAYDVLKPNISAINFGDNVFKTDQRHYFISKTAKSVIPIIVGMFALVIWTMFSFPPRVHEKLPNR